MCGTIFQLIIYTRFIFTLHKFYFVLICSISYYCVLFCFLTLFSIDFIEDREADAPVKMVASELLKEDLAEVLCTLSPRERDVLRLRFGMDDGRQRTLEEVGQLFGVTRERIRQIEAKALRKLRHPNRKKKLEEYVE